MEYAPFSESEIVKPGMGRILAPILGEELLLKSSLSSIPKTQTIAPLLSADAAGIDKRPAQSVKKHPVARVEAVHEAEVTTVRRKESLAEVFVPVQSPVRPPTDRKSSSSVAVTQILPFTDGALMRLLGHFVNAYQQGNLLSFMGLFASHAQTSDEFSHAEIRREYKKLFSDTSNRRLHISNLHWKYREHVAQGEGVMKLQLLRGGRMERYIGKFTIEVSRRQRQLVIRGLYYDLEPF
jgi:hypothetical protein